MLQALKKQTLIGKLWVIIGLLLATAAIGMLFGPAALMLVQGPTYFEPLDDNDIAALQGRYLEADVDTLVDYYAETVRSESAKRDETTLREYIMPINTPDATIYIGVELPKSKLADAEAIVADTQRMLDDEDGSYEWDGSYVNVRGTLQPMDAETEALFRAYFRDAGFDDSEIGLSDDCYFRPLVLTDGKINGDKADVLIFMSVIGLLTLLGAVWTFIHALTGGYQKQLRRYIAASSDPQGTEQALDRFYEDTMQEGAVRMSRNWLLYVRGGESFVLAGDDVVWAYQHTLRRKMYGIVTVGKEVSVKVYSASEKKADRCHTIYLRNEDEARKVLEDLQRTYPNAMIGYDADLERRYNADPAAFHRDVIAARQAPAQPAQEPAPAE